MPALKTICVVQTHDAFRVATGQVKSYFEVTYFGREGIDTIKAALLKGIQATQCDIVQADPLRTAMVVEFCTRSLYRKYI